MRSSNTRASSVAGDELRAEAGLEVPLRRQPVEVLVVVDDEQRVEVDRLQHLRQRRQDAGEHTEDVVLPVLVELEHPVGAGAGGAGLLQPGTASASADWVLELDQNREDDVLGVLAGILPPLSEVLQPIDLDPLLVVDDDQYLD